MNLLKLILFNSPNHPVSDVSEERGQKPVGGVAGKARQPQLQSKIDLPVSTILGLMAIPYILKNQKGEIILSLIWKDGSAKVYSQLRPWWTTLKNRLNLYPRWLLSASMFWKKYFPKRNLIPSRHARDRQGL